MSRFLAVWTAVLLFVLVRYSSTRLPPLALLYGLPALGTAALLVLRRPAMRAFLQEHAVLFGAATALAALACAAQLGAADGFVQDFERVLPQPALLLALPPLAYAFRSHPRLVRAWALVACALALWQLFALPVEGVSGMRMGWYRSLLPERDAGPLHYQAAGLASQPYFFAGFMLPLFYLAWGWVWDQLDALRHRWQRAAMRVLLLAWVGAVACVQSRSALVGAALASAGLGLMSLPPERRRQALVALAVLLAGVAVAYVALFSQNKSGAGLRWAYAQLYLRESFDGLRLLTGHGFSGYPPAAMKLPDYPISHSHNDLVQVLYSWGLAALVAYVVLLAGIVRRALRLAREGVMWPVACLVALAPNMVTDLGVQHYEKAAFLVVLAALCIAQRPRAPAQLTGVS
jgi:hypothetical protein